MFEKHLQQYNFIGRFVAKNSKMPLKIELTLLLQRNIKGIVDIFGLTGTLHHIIRRMTPFAEMDEVGSLSL